MTRSTDASEFAPGLTPDQEEEFDIDSILLDGEEKDEPIGLDARLSEDVDPNKLLAAITQGLLMAHARLDVVDERLGNLITDAAAKQGAAHGQAVKTINQSITSMHAEVRTRFTDIQASDQKLQSFMTSWQKIETTRANEHYQTLLNQLASASDCSKREGAETRKSVHSESTNSAASLRTTEAAILSRIQSLEAAIATNARSAKTHSLISVSLGCAIFLLLLFLTWKQGLL